MDMSMVQAREKRNAALDAFTAAKTAIQNAKPSDDLEKLEANFNRTSDAYDSANADYKVAEAAYVSRRLADGVRVTHEHLTYQKGSPNSIFRDLYNASRGDYTASQRLDRHKQEMRVERPQAKFDLNSTDATGGYLVAPLYLQDDFAPFLRAGAASVQAIGTRPLPPNTDSINVPTMETGTATAVQSSDNSGIQETDAGFGTRAADVKTIAGLQDVSRQVVDRGVPGTDEVIFADLASDFAQKWDVAVLNSSTTNFKGLLQVSGINSVTYTAATPTVAGLYPKLADAIQRIHTGVYGPPTAILMHPRRWAFILAGLDSQNRPMVVPDDQLPTNAAGRQTGVASEGVVGTLQGLPVYVDANIPTTLGAGTNEDRIIVVRAPEMRIWAAPDGPYLERFDDVGSANLTVRFRLHQYVAHQLDRRPTAISVVSGTGCATPAF